MQPKQVIDVQLIDGKGNKVAIPNIMIDAEFFVGGKPRFTFTDGRTDTSGKLRVTYDDLEARRKDMARFYLMDYNTKLDECDPGIAFKVPSEEVFLTWRDSAIRDHGKPPSWAQDWPANKRVSSAGKTVTPQGDVTHTEIVCELVSVGAEGEE